ncbi:hypothetical protein OSB04_028047 [Centaurea solstitialis]|uniref:MULE transposase domain-containing protein n=1 Tax=Centaurea solstitialis TaxID=347529 RepID=A0AA38SRX3_9ASTR|nr:hypothetical protein OSB04_028047 [Centaurea solstitialis]
MISFVGDKDLQMLINLMMQRKQYAPGFFVEYLIVEGEFHAVLWSNEILQMNYNSVTVSFDAIYRTNRHSMNFILFIAIDNHKRSVVIRYALISHEDVDNFTWVLKAFLKAREKQPRFVITDKCLAMKQAIPVVFTESKNHLCAWHILRKMPNKVIFLNEAYDLIDNLAFKKQINRLVWRTHISIEEFEDGWEKTINEFGLQGQEWLTDIFEIREPWISAYYQYDPMSALIRTKSRLESSHAYFRLFASVKNDLKQRNKHACLEFTTRKTFPRCFTPLGIERHTSEVYTRLIRKSIFFCGLDFMSQDGDLKRYNVTMSPYLQGLMNDGVDKILESFICKRWTRALIPEVKAPYGEIDVEKESLINGMYVDMDLIVNRVRNDKKTLREAFDSIAELKVKYKAEEQGRSTSDSIDDVEVLPTAGIRIMGIGHRKHLIGALKKAIEKNKHVKRCVVYVTRTRTMICSNPVTEELFRDLVRQNKMLRKQVEVLQARIRAFEGIRREANILKQDNQHVLDEYWEVKVQLDDTVNMITHIKARTADDSNNSQPHVTVDEVNTPTSYQ